jgi:anti-anti-sigma factor
MHNKSSQLPQDIYHRLYWYGRRKVDPAKIAAALNLPIKTVRNLIEKLGCEPAQEPNAAKAATPALQDIRPSATANAADFLDLFVFTKTRYSVVDISGSIVKHHLQKLRDTLYKISRSDRKPFALKMTEVHLVDESGIGALKTLYTGFKHQERYCAILDPSPDIEPIIKHYGLDAIIPIFGTELAFEEHAFR